MSDFTHKIIESFMVTVFFGLIYPFYYKFISYSWKDSIKNSLLISFIFFIVSILLKNIGLYNFISNIL
ncbi:hypothetical protein MCW_01171 [Cardidatus Bartonella washoeensis 085-0475]|uniref:Uncharacterized protein n=1 Tax=Cardidatus Bartonella washoeensis 085-0475 TaxID=1094564 RepID=J0QGB5_9HYPH|nr:hypothetical protein MCW_01171 [Bartonella washoeensis 085-0475]